jgi:hypothetical protein
LLNWGAITKRFPAWSLMVSINMIEKGYNEVVAEVTFMIRNTDVAGFYYAKAKR